MQEQLQDKEVRTYHYICDTVPCPKRCRYSVDVECPFIEPKIKNNHCRIFPSLMENFRKVD